ncbi:MAG: FkbM family methyltransferase [Rhodospirillaceae bacterium]|nr:FkbM family methyltransferase [Rhodospirillaceae bacterium]
MITTVIDVGANEGQFGLFLRRRLHYRGKIISIEPLPDAFAKLESQIRDDPSWSAMNLALGAAEATLSFNVAANSQSSSFLPMTHQLLESAPEIRYNSSIDVRVRRLDSVEDIRNAANDRSLLKIDSQGFEHEILVGAGDALNRISLLYLELSLVPLYEGEWLIEEMISFLRGKNFVPISIHQGYCNPQSGEQLQADVLFCKNVI